MDVVTYALAKQSIAGSVDTWLEENVAQETGYVLDRTLEMSNAAAPADLVGEIGSAITTAQIDSLFS